MLLPDLSGSNELTWGKGRGQSYLWEWEGQKQASSLTHVTTCKQNAFHRDRSKIEKEARNLSSSMSIGLDMMCGKDYWIYCLGFTNAL